LGALSDTGAEVCWGDIADSQTLEAAVDGVDLVVNCAAKTGPWGPESEYARTNVSALETLVRTAVRAGVRRIVHVSSVTVHGNDVKGDADENAPLRGEPNPYSRSKVAGERLLQRLIREERAPLTVVRPGWIYGPRDAASFARFAGMVQTGRMTMIGSGDNHLPLIYVRDVAEGILLAGQVDEAEGRCYLLVNDEPVTQRAFLTEIAAALDVPPPTRHAPYAMALSLGAAAEHLGRLSRRRRPPPVMRYGVQMLGGENRFSIVRARRELGFSPQVGMVEGVRRSVEWYRAADEIGTADRVASG
jgi:nucleoside-diphosphate-sugar epimerase